MGDYTVKQQGAGFWQICDAKNNAAYLIEGDSRALLIDTMMSEEPLLPLLRTLTTKPILLALTHAHIDHMYHSAEFDTVYLHQKDLLDWKKGLGMAMWLGTPLFKVKRRRYKTARFIPLHDDSEIDLGGFSVKLLRVSGHTNGSVVFIDDRHRAILCGDAVGSGSGVWMFLPLCANVSTYQASLTRAVEALRAYAHYVYCGGHIEQDCTAAPLSLQTFSDMRLLCERILDGTAELKLINRIPGVPLFYGKEGAAAILTRKKKIK